MNWNKTFNRKSTCFLVLLIIIIIIASNGCSVALRKFYAEEFNKIPKLSIDWTKYPEINPETLTRKPITDFTKILSSEYPGPKQSSVTIKNFFLWEDISIQEVFCIDLNKNFLLWSRKYHNYSYIKFPHDADYIIIQSVERIEGYDSLWIISLDLSNGKENWKYTRPEWKRSSKVEPNIYVDILSQNDKYVILIIENLDDHEKDLLSCIDIKTGKELWTKNNVSEGWKCLIINDKILYRDLNGSLLAINAITGSLLWKNSTIKLSDNFKYIFPERDLSILINNNVILMNNSMIDKINQSIFQLNIDTGEVIKKGIRMLDNQNKFLIQEMSIAKNTNKQPEGFMIISYNEEYFLSKVDIINMRELWRIPLGTWNLSEKEDIYCDLYFEERMPDKIYFYWNANSEDPSNQETNGIPIRLPDGFYEIDSTNGNFLWWTEHGHGLDNGILRISDTKTVNSSQDSNGRYFKRFALVDIYSKNILSVTKIYTEYFINIAGYADPYIRIFTFSERSGTKEIFSYLEWDCLKNELIAFYPNLYDENISDFIIKDNLGIFKIKDKDELLVKKYK